ncbi:hypothetical protein CAPTEDRAFT_204771 [Capitella teleta]|uniref:Uncharacterized protein n=1 Tax=Capitella teleta TaxID=283909 RepID=R7UQS1_CAPTE|nr:hypothetical protein CAPTEDRAFT_204771 [Capitella teleta]|eukprot:ELU08520.1 hypothetical protein CAPTEDRAFT_204771 [Capitella teleta]
MHILKASIFAILIFAVDRDLEHSEIKFLAKINEFTRSFTYVAQTFSYVYNSCHKSGRRTTMARSDTSVAMMIGPDLYALYQKQRPLTESSVRKLIKLKVSTKVLHDHAQKEFSKNLTCRDEIKGEDGVHQNQAQLLLRAIEEEKAKDLGLVLEVGMDEDRMEHAKKEVKDKLKEACSKLVECRALEEYEKRLEELRGVHEVFYRYFVKNWDSKREMWAMFAHNGRVNFGDQTSNRIESFHQKLKSEVPRFGPLDITFENVMLVLSTLENTITHRLFKKVMRRIPTNERKLQQSLTPYAFKQVQEQIAEAHAYSCDAANWEVKVWKIQQSRDGVQQRIVSHGSQNFQMYMNALKVFEEAVAQHKIVVVFASLGPGDENEHVSEQSVVSGDSSSVVDIVVDRTGAERVGEQTQQSVVSQGSSGAVDRIEDDGVGDVMDSEGDRSVGEAPGTEVMAMQHDGERKMVSFQDISHSIQAPTTQKSVGRPAGFGQSVIGTTRKRGKKGDLKISKKAKADEDVICA